MNSSAPHELQRQTLHRRLQANRLALAQEVSGRLAVADDGFPRSHTMRFLSSTPGIVTFLIAEFGPILLGRYLANRKRDHH